MRYKEVKELYSKTSFISRDTSIKQALETMQDNKLDVLIIKDNKNGLTGIITKDEFLWAYRLGVSLDDSIKHVVSCSYRLMNENEEIKEEIFFEVPFIIITDDNNNILGIISEEILSIQLLKLSVKKMKTETATKRLLYRNVKIKLENQQNNTDYFIDFYNMITKLIYINNELWDIIQYSSDSIYVTDGDGITLYANHSFEKMTGTSVKAVLGMSIFDAEVKGIYKPSISAIVLREKRPVTLMQTACNGKVLIVTGTPVYDIDGNIYMTICNSKDIDELSILKNYLVNIKSTSVKITNMNSRIIYSSHYMIDLMKLVNKITQINLTVLITGESGTGKGLIARYIHENSKRSNGKLIEINCSAIPDALFEAELFGYASGAFTGAKKGGKLGLIEMANKGTLFLDEIGDMPMHMQVKLLKVLQDRQVTRVGAVDPIDIDIRVIAATNKDLKQLIEKELFRIDLYYRLNVFPIHLAPLRERKEDIYILLQHYLLHYNKEHSGNVILTQKAQDELANYRWPGNVRELEHFIERLVIIKNGAVDTCDLEIESDVYIDKNVVIINKLLPLKEAVYETERQLINIAMKTSRNSYNVAKLLEISQASAFRKIKKYT